MTNGVDFALVDGACCLVKFSNSGSHKSVGSFTLNINSTGAKNILAYHSSMTSGQFQNTYSTNGQYNGWSGPLPLRVMFCYDGSSYVTGSTRTYADYNDSD